MPSASASRGLPISTGCAVDADLAGVLAVGAAEDLHQRRLAGAVLAEQHVHFAGVQRQIDAVERDDAGKGLADAAHLEHRRGCAGAHGIGPRTAGRRRRCVCRPCQLQQRWRRARSVVEHEDLVDAGQAHRCRRGRRLSFGRRPARTRARAARERRHARVAVRQRDRARKQPSRDDAILRHAAVGRQTQLRPPTLHARSASAALPTVAAALRGRRTAADRESCPVPGGASATILPSRRSSCAITAYSHGLRVHHRFARHVARGRTATGAGA